MRCTIFATTLLATLLGSAAVVRMTPEATFVAGTNATLAAANRNISSSCAATLTSAKTYADAAVAGAGHTTPSAVTNIAGRVTSNVVTKAYVEGLGIAACDTNAVQGIINANVASNYLCTVATLNAEKARAMAAEAGLAPLEGENGTTLIYTHTVTYEGGGRTINDGVFATRFLVDDDPSGRNLWDRYMAYSANVSGRAQTLPEYLDSLAWRTTGNRTLADYGITNGIPVVAAADPTFSNAVMAVGFGVSSNDVAVIREMVGTIGDLPIGGGVATLGGLLAALVASVVWLKKNALRKGLTNGVPDDPNVSTLFTSANTSLMGVCRYPIAPIATTGTDERKLKDAHINTITTSASKELILPAAGSQARDLIVTATLSASAGITFSATDAGGVSLTYVAEDWSAIASEDGTNVFALTEISANTFMVARKTVAEES